MPEYWIILLNVFIFGFLSLAPRIAGEEIETKEERLIEIILLSMALLNAGMLIKV